MAEEEIIIIEEEEAAGLDIVAETYEDEDTAKPAFKLKRKHIIIASVSLFLLLFLLILLNLGNDKPMHKNIVISEEQTTEKEKIKHLSSSQIQQMITRANVLYESGHKNDALKLYEKIATFSESISYYNLGVAQLKDKQYEKAIKSFNLAIKNKQNLCVSSLNAAVASLELNDKKRFQNYINMAYSYLPEESTSPMYSYYYSLVNFYQENYLEALSSLEHRSSENYVLTQDQLHAKINILFSSYYSAISNLEKNYQDENSFTLGLLYANLGDSVLAKKYLRLAIEQRNEPVKAQLALSYITLKAGQIDEASVLLNSITDMYPDEIYNYYPIETYLKESLFDIDLAQNNFHENIIHNTSTIYQILFYFAPYKIFNADRTISYIRKGNANISIDNISGASGYLNTGASLSNVNLNIAKSIHMALNFKLQEANQKLQELVNTYPNHSILQYNLGLTYAQLGKINLAHKHFLKSNHLDAKNYLSGIFAIMCAKIINQENPTFNKILKSNLAHEDKTPEFDLYRALLHFKEGNFPATYAWIEEVNTNKPFHLAFETLIAKSMNKDKIAQKSIQKLIKVLPDDILPHLMYIDIFYSKEDNKFFARKAMAHLKHQKFHMDDYYYGPFITKYLYTQYAQITGSLYPLKQELQDRLSIETKNPISIMQALALVSIYTKDFEQAYSIYNELIDTFKQQDSHTLFLAAIAATGAQHPANAIALLELARRKNPKHKESRYALGLLYLQTQNNKGAVTAFRYMGSMNFQSQFFNFRIKTNKD